VRLKEGSEKMFKFLGFVLKQKQEKNLEFKVLQSTIDPHFLYNSLDMIYWSAIQNNDVEVSNMAKALSKF
jgi:sensor histidine kinase YesM